MGKAVSILVVTILFLIASAATIVGAGFILLSQIPLALLFLPVIYVVWGVISYRILRKFMTPAVVVPLIILPIATIIFFIHGIITENAHENSIFDVVVGSLYRLLGIE